MSPQISDQYTPYQQAVLAEIGMFGGFAVVPRAWLASCLGSVSKGFPPADFGGQTALARILGSLVKWQTVKLLHAEDRAPCYMLRETWKALPTAAQNALQAFLPAARGKPALTSVTVLGPALLTSELGARYPFPVETSSTDSDLQVSLGAEVVRVSMNESRVLDVGPLPQSIPAVAFKVPVSTLCFRLEFFFPSVDAKEGQAGRLRRRGAQANEWLTARKGRLGLE